MYYIYNIFKNFILHIYFYIFFIHIPWGRKRISLGLLFIKVKSKQVKEPIYSFI